MKICNIEISQEILDRTVEEVFKNPIEPPKLITNMSYTYTQTYSILEVSKTTFNDIRIRLAKVNMLGDYLTLDDDGKEIIILGTVALKSEG